MGNIGDFDALSVEPHKAFDPVPPGEYRAFIVNSEVKDTSNGKGEYLKLEWIIAEGQFANRRVFQNINIKNPNAQAQRIAQGELSAICRATGKSRVVDSSELHNIPVIIKLRIKPANGDYPAANKVADINAIVGSAAPAPAQPEAVHVQAPAGHNTTASAPSLPPWQRK